MIPSLQWRHNERDGVSNQQPHDCLLNRLFKAQIKENIKAPRDRWIHHTKASDAENVSIWWRHQGDSRISAPPMELDAVMTWKPLGKGSRPHKEPVVRSIGFYVIILNKL